MTTLRTVRQVAAETGFRPDAVEKVLRLGGVLERLDRHPTTRGAWVVALHAQRPLSLQLRCHEMRVPLAV